MITFVMVNPKKDIDLSYIPDFLGSEVSSMSNIGNCKIFNESESEWEAKIETRNSNIYFVNFSLNTYKGTKQLSVVLQPQKDMHFDDQLHDLKIKLKEALKKDWEQILWLTDEQSSRFAESLYGRIYRVENELRNFINMVMVKKLGASWWDKYVPEEVRNKHKARQGAYKRLAVSFQNVNDHLLAIDTDDLLIVMTNVLRKWQPIYDNEVEKLIEKRGSLSQGEVNKLIRKLKDQLIVEVKIWDAIFEPYLSNSFLSDWEDFSKNRNHIAHNKLIDQSANEKMLENIKCVEEMIHKASEKFSKTEISDEDREQLEILREIIEEDANMRVYEMAGVEVRNKNQILSMFEDSLLEFVSDIQDQIYFRPDLDVECSPMLNLEELTTIELLKISNRIDGSNVILKSTIEELSGEPGSTSLLMLGLFINNREVANCKITNSNGDAEWDSEEGYYQQTAVEDFDASELEKLEIILMEKIDEISPDYLSELHAKQYSSVKDGGTDPIADFACEECEENSVSLVDSIGGRGKCVKCGHQHDLKVCIRCESTYNPNIEGSNSLCDGCDAYIEAQ